MIWEEKGITEDGKNIIAVESREVAKIFGKDHSEIISEIERLIDELIETGVSEIEDYFILSKGESGNEENKEYFMTADGCMLLIMKLSGEKAMRFKLAYLDRVVVKQ